MSNGNAIVIPQWIDSNLFENVVKDNVKAYRSIKSFNVKSGSAAGENYATVMLRVEIELELDDGTTKPISFMLKTCIDNEQVREMLKFHDMFDVEKCMYEQIVPAFEKLYADAGIQVTFGPKSYVLNTEHPYILLEDLSPQGCKNANRLEGLDAEHTESALEMLAQWHAASAVYAEQNGEYEDKYMYGFFRPENKDMMLQMHERMDHLFLGCVKEYANNESYINDIETTSIGVMHEMFKVKADPNEFNVLNHGDFWCNNIMFQYDAMGKRERTYLIDYQLCRYGTPAQDLFYFLLSSTSYDVKLSKFDYFIRFYHEHLVKNLKVLKYSKNLPTLRDIHKMLYKYDMYGFSSARGIMAVVLLDPTENASIENFISESEEGKNFQKQLYSNARFRKHMEAVLPWLQNRGALSY